MKKVIIIGGGIAGLSAGIYALQGGFAVEIYEKNAMVGGECTGWNRQGYHIDNCIHWLTGCRPEDDLYKIWRNIGAIDDTTEFYREPYFYMLESDGKKLHLWCDLEKARKEFLAIAPEDETELNKFFDSVKLAECVRVPSEKSLADMSFIEYMKLGMSMAGMGRVMKEYGKDTIADLANRFKNKYVKEMISCYLSGSYMAITFITSYGFYTSGTAAIPKGGSVGMVNRIAKRFEELGGKIHTKMSASKINISNGKAQSVSFEDGSTVSCDHVICAADPTVTFGKLLPPEYMDKKLVKMYSQTDGYNVSSIFNVSFGIIGEKAVGDIGGSCIFSCESFKAGRKTVNHMGLRMYDYDDTLFPKEKRVIQSSILQDTEDYEYWNSIYDDKERYNAEKQRIADAVKERIYKQYPQLNDRLILLGTYSPVTFTKWCGAYKGSYMSFFQMKGYRSLTAKNNIKGLSNVFIGSQWLTTNGGLPTAVTSGKFAAEKMIKMSKK
ncbi:MAG: phytoene desaturase family protein [Oscillospiraceae bacterium]